jgi:DNA-binding response OmpR family regulator
MKKPKIFLIDFNSSNNVGYTLQGILKSCSDLGVHFQEESSKPSLSDFCGDKLYSLIARCRPDLMFLVLSSCLLNEAKPLFQSMKSDFSELPIIVAVDTCKPNAMLSLLNLGAADFVTAPFKETDILPRIWRLLKRRTQEETLSRRLKKKPV